MLIIKSLVQKDKCGHFDGKTIMIPEEIQWTIGMPPIENYMDIIEIIATGEELQYIKNQYVVGSIPINWVTNKMVWIGDIARTIISNLR